MGENQGRVGVADVPARARLVEVRVRFAKVRIPLGDRAVLGFSTFGNPTADRKPKGEGGMGNASLDFAEIRLYYVSILPWVERTDDGPQGKTS